MELALENEYRKVAMEFASKAIEALTVERDELRYGLDQMTRQFEGANRAFNRAMQLKDEAESALVQAEQARDEARQQVKAVIEATDWEPFKAARGYLERLSTRED